jgi:hypothetical protein
MYPRPWWFLPAAFVGVALVAVVILFVIEAVAG